MRSLAIGDVASLPSEDGKRVAIIGAGVAGLSAAQKLRWKKLNPVCFEARNRVGGRVLTTRLGGPCGRFHKRAEGAASHDVACGVGPPVDCGASILTAFEESSQWVARHAREAKIRAPLCVGGRLYEPTENAAWYHKGVRIPQKRIQSLHDISHKSLVYANAYALHMEPDEGEEDMDVGELVKEAIEQVTAANKVTLSATNRKIVDKIMVRAQAYCCSFSDLPMEAVKEWISDKSPEKFPPLLREIRLDDDKTIKDLADMNERQLKEKPEVILAHENSEHEERHDRIVLDGYSPFLIDRLADGVDVCLNTIVKTVEVNQGDEGPKVTITTADGTKVYADYAIVTLPLGVLKRRDHASSVEFRPSLSDEKQRAIAGFGMGVHNKVILWFRKEDVFWPEDVVQLNCADERFQFFNLHAYGHMGLMVAHVFNGSGFAQGYNGLNDYEVVNAAVKVLHGMFFKPEEDAEMRDVAGGDAEMHDANGNANGFSRSQTVESGSGSASADATLDRAQRKLRELPRPLDYVVTRWDQDPFAFGSYSYWKKGSNWDPAELGRSEHDGRILFAGEHTDPEGWQCVEGAFRSGIKAGHDVLVDCGEIRGTSRMCDIPPMSVLTEQRESSPKKHGRRPSGGANRGRRGGRANGAKRGGGGANGVRKGGATGTKRGGGANGSKKGGGANGSKKGGDANGSKKGGGANDSNSGSGSMAA